MSAAICRSSHSGPPRIRHQRGGARGRASVRGGRSSGVTRVGTFVISGRNSRRKLLYSAVLIAGPTASGKSALALRLAERLGGTIINANWIAGVSRPARPHRAAERAGEQRVRHVFFGAVDGATNFSVGRCLAAASSTRESAPSRIPILPAGRGLYFKALYGFVRYTVCSRSHSGALGRRLCAISPRESHTSSRRAIR